MTTLAGRNYARALFELAVATGNADSVEQDLRAATAVFFDEAEVRAFLSNRLIGRTAKKRAIRGALEGKVDGRVMVLLYLLVERGRTMLLGEICEELERLSRLARGVRKVTLDTAFPLEAEEIRRITGALESQLSTRVELETSDRPSLVGGVRAFSEGEEIELSVEGRLKDLHEQLARGSSRKARRKDAGPR